MVGVVSNVIMFISNFVIIGHFLSLKGIHTHLHAGMHACTHTQHGGDFISLFVP
jgi:hypothetical protein